jgi:PKD domain
VTGRGRRGAAALCVVLAAMTALLACAASAPAASPPPPISITIDDGLSASDSGTALPPVVFGTGEQVTTDDAALLRLALTLARTEHIAVADSPSFLLGILLENGEPISATDAVSLLLGIRLEDGETVSGADAVSLLLGLRLADGETVSTSDVASLLLGIRQTIGEPVSVGDEVSAKPVNRPPVASAGGPYAAAEGSPVALHGSATDPDGDPLTYAWDVGGVAASGADATATAPDGPATVPVKLTVCDDHGACATDTTTLTVSNVPPAVTLTAAPSPVSEGGTFTLTALVTDPSAADTTAGFAFQFDCGGGTFTLAAGLSTSCPAVDDPGVTARVRVTDKDGGSTVATVAVAIANVAPAVKITAPAPGAVFFVGSHVPLAASFTDPGVRDTHTASFTVGGATLPGTVTESGGSGTASTTWTPGASGLDTLTALVRDNAGAIGSASQTLIVADQFGSATGAGTIGRRHERLLFTFEARYPRGAGTPTGSVTVAGRGVVFHATSLAWLVVTGRTATLQGTGVANGAGGYSFTLQAVDGFPNRVAIKIWKTATGAVLLDTGAPAALAFGDVTVRG